MTLQRFLLVEVNVKNSLKVKVVLSQEPSHCITFPPTKSQLLLLSKEASPFYLSLASDINTLTYNLNSISDNGLVTRVIRHMVKLKKKNKMQN